MVWDDTSRVTKPELQPPRGFWGAVSGYHLVNVLLPFIPASLVVAIVWRRAGPGPRLAGGVFALHPVRVEAFAWISEPQRQKVGAAADWSNCRQSMFVLASLWRATAASSTWAAYPLGLEVPIRSHGPTLA